MHRQKHISKGMVSLYTTMAHHLQQGDAIALWQLPHTNTITLLASSVVTLSPPEVPITTLKPGFIIAPFNRKKEYLVLPADNVYTFDNDTNLSDSPSLPFHTLPLSPASSQEDKANYLDSIRAGINHIKKGFFKKAVLARREVISPPKEESGLNPLNLFRQLCNRYPDAFVSLLSTPDTGTWLGASPELLLKLDNTPYIKTMAIAGTLQVRANHNTTSIQWGKKEMEEQDLVSQYIVKCFKKIGIDTFKKCGPTTYRAGNVLHLKTDFTITTFKTVNHLQAGACLLRALHPTPAVCGDPQSVAETFLHEREPFNRQLYGGYIGPVHVQQQSHMYVNLRCMQWGRNALVLYAGAGITHHSIPEKEWEETVLKMNTLLHTLNSKAFVPSPCKPSSKEHAH